jgi:hypothetical protein
LVDDPHIGAMADDADKLRAYLVRELVANLKIRKPVGAQSKFRLSLCQQFYSELDHLQPTHLLRAYEALCDVDFPEPDTAALRDVISRRLYVIGRLKDSSGVMIPGREKYVAKS